MRSIGTALGAAFIVFGTSAPASAASTKDRVEVLEQQVAELRNAASANATATVRINSLEQQIQSLTGRIEELSYELEQANARLNAVTAALSGDALGAAEFGSIDPATGAPAPTGPVQLSPGDPLADQLPAGPRSAPATGGPSTGVAGDVALPLNPDAAFTYASDFLLNGDYERARAAFELYVAAFPNHPRAADAQFRLGEIYLATDANAEAADAFIAHIRKHPNDPRAAEAYLKLGTAFSRMEQPQEACKVFKTLRSKYPNASPAVLQRAGIEMDRINCQ